MTAFLITVGAVSAVVIPLLALGILRPGKQVWRSRW